MSDSKKVFGDNAQKPTSSSDSQRAEEASKAAGKADASNQAEDEGSPSSRRVNFEIPAEKKEAFKEAVQKLGTTQKAVLERAVEKVIEKAQEYEPPDVFE